MTNLNRQIMAIALPAIASNITTPLLGLIDTAIVGHLGSAAYMGAIAVGAAMFSMLYMIFGFLRMGSSGLTAQAYGRGSRPEYDSLFYLALGVGLALSMLMLVFQRPLGHVILNYIDPVSGSRQLAWQYFTTAIWGAPAVLGTFALNGWLLGMQNSRTVMWMALVTNLVNIAVSFTLVFGLGMKIRGVALGTVTAQWAGIIFGLSAALLKYRPHFHHLLDTFNWARLRQFFRVNRDIFIRTLCLVAVTTWFTRSGAGQSVTILAANAMLMQLFLFFSYFMDGFAYAGEAIGGKYYGRHDMASLHLTVKTLMWWSAILSVFFGLLYLIGGNAILTLLTDDHTVIITALEFVPWIVVVPFVGVLAFVFDGIFIGLTHTRSMLVSLAVATAVFFALYLLLFPTLHNHGLWLAFVVYLAVRGLVLALIYRHHLQA